MAKPREVEFPSVTGTEPLHSPEKCTTNSTAQRKCYMATLTIPVSLCIYDDVSLTVYPVENRINIIQRTK
jgi:hypothetical protein